MLQPLASLKAVCLDLAIRGHTVGYLPGAGDSVAENLQADGLHRHECWTTRISQPNRLRELDAVVIGVRAFNVRTNLAAQLPALFAYVEDGGNVIEQYNRPDGLEDRPACALQPASFERSRDR